VGKPRDSEEQAFWDATAIAVFVKICTNKDTLWSDNCNFAMTAANELLHARRGYIGDEDASP
jgi:hypothetical protein